MDRQRLLKRLDAAWRDFQQAHAGLSDAQLLLPGVTGKWSVRDILAHVTTWEEEALKHLPAIRNGERPPRYSVAFGGIDAFNAIKTEEKRNLSLADVQHSMYEVHSRLVAYIESVPEGLLRTETRFRRRLRLDTYSHYAIHAQAIRNWREKKSFRTARNV